MSGPPNHGLIGESAEINELRRMIGKASRNRLPVLLLGETGTGKEVAARAIFESNPRGPFVPIDCGSLVGTLMESELFGHVKSAFTGAFDNKKGLVESANGGTAFLDEIGDLPLDMQVKLLRVVQESQLRPVGSLEWRKVDLRIIAATHRDLKAEVAAGRFRQDLYYRLNVFPIRLPPLRKRKQDVPLLVNHFLGGFTLSSEILDVLLSYDWPGNVRELKHCVERMAAMQSEGALQMADLPSVLQHRRSPTDLDILSKLLDGESDLPQVTLSPRSPVISLPESEKQSIIHALAATNGERAKAARLLKIGRTTLYRKMKEYGFD